MTAPNPVPDTYRPHSAPGCTFIVAPGKRCATEDTDTLSHLGRRCADHAPSFDADTAVEIAAAGWPDTAAAYCRWSG